MDHVHASQPQVTLAELWYFLQDQLSIGEQLFITDQVIKLLTPQTQKFKQIYTDKHNHITSRLDAHTVRRNQILLVKADQSLHLYLLCEPSQSKFFTQCTPLGLFGEVSLSRVQYLLTEHSFFLDFHSTVLEGIGSPSDILLYKYVNHVFD